jgi:membrane associated rhomboid family serine protease
MIPLGTDAPQRRTPLMNYFLITTCVVIYLISHRATSPAHPYGLAHGWARFMLNPRHLELVQFITYIFLHANFMHILGNMIFLWVFGNQVNDRLGHLAYLFFFLAGGILAGCGQVLSSVHGNPTLGASGSIAAVAGLFLALCPLVNIRVWFFVVIFDVASFWFVLAQIFLFDVYGAFVRNDDVAHWAHLTGYLTGFVTGMVILLLRLVPRDHYDLLSLLNRARRRAAYRQMVSRGYNPFDKPVPPPPGVTKIAGPVTVADPAMTQLSSRVQQHRREHDMPAAAAAYRELMARFPMARLPSDTLLDVANQLVVEKDFKLAAGAYELVLSSSGSGKNNDEIKQILGLIYARYLGNGQRALELFQSIVDHIHDPQRRAFLQDEISAIKSGNQGGSPDRAIT